MGESGRACRANVRVVEKVVRKLDRLFEHGLSPPPQKKSLPAPKHTATQDFLGGGGCLPYFGPVS